jgi:Tfp pilus assembly protein PilN
MKPVRLHFARQDASPAWLAGHVPRAAGMAPVALAVAFVGLGAVAWQAWDTEAELATARQALQAAQRPNTSPLPSTERTPATLTPAQRTAWTQMARQLNTPWSALLDALEASLPDEVALVAIEPDASQGTVRLQVEAKSLDTLLAYARELRSIPLFANVDLVKHETNEQDVNRPVRLGLNIRLRAGQAAPSEPQEATR